ncbi:MAG: hypothetical protein AB1Z67_00300 [Candidatus Limnocylindrales bacterium]
MSVTSDVATGVAAGEDAAVDVDVAAGEDAGVDVDEAAGRGEVAAAAGVTAGEGEIAAARGEGVSRGADLDAGVACGRGEGEGPSSAATDTGPREAGDVASSPADEATVVQDMTIPSARGSRT